MPIAIQQRGAPETRVLISAVLDRDLGHLVALGYEFPRVLLADGVIGVRIERPLP